MPKQRLDIHELGTGLQEPSCVGITTGERNPAGLDTYIRKLPAPARSTRWLYPTRSRTHQACGW